MFFVNFPTNIFLKTAENLLYQRLLRKVRKTVNDMVPDPRVSHA